MADEESNAEPTTEESSGGVTVEVVEEKGKPHLPDEEVIKLTEDVPGDDEIGRYAKDAQRRIKNLHIAGQEWRRRAAQSGRDVATATSLAEQLYRENQELKANVGRSEQALIEQAIQRAEAQLGGAKNRARNAYAAQDTDAIVTANEEVSRYVAEVDRLRLLKPVAAEKDEAAASPAAAPSAVPAGPKPVSEGTRRWIEKNSWFGKSGEEAITGFTLGVHQSLERQGITEESNPTEYWNTINKELKERYPERFKPVGEPTRPVAVTGGMRVNGDASESSSGGRRHVRLSESQVRIAQALGVTKEQYAAQLVKEEQQRDREKARATVQ